MLVPAQECYAKGKVLQKLRKSIKSLFLSPPVSYYKHLRFRFHHSDFSHTSIAAQLITCTVERAVSRQLLAGCKLSAWKRRGRSAWAMAPVAILNFNYEIIVMIWRSLRYTSGVNSKHCYVLELYYDLNKWFCRQSRCFKKLNVSDLCDCE